MVKANPISIDPEVMNGTPVFRGTRVPVEYLFDFFETDSTVDDFIHEYPTVKRSVVMEYLKNLRAELIASEIR